MNILIWVLFAHFLADFVFQSRWMGENKSKDASAMAAHIGVYTLILGWLMLPFATPTLMAFAFALVNGIAHLVTDSISSNASAYFYREKRMHEFWCTIGFDQFAHVAVLILTLPMLGA